MKKLKYVFIIISIILLVLSIIVNIPEKRKEIQTSHFTFQYSSNIDSLRIVGLSKALEGKYSNISRFLNTVPAKNIEVNIYAQRWRYIKATGNWSASGSIEGISKLHFVENSWLESEIGKIAVHEFVHAVVLKLLLDRAPVPLNVESFDKKFQIFPVWLWEGVSVYEAEQFYDPKTLAYFNNGKYPEISELNNRSDGQKIYTCGYTIIEYLLKEYGKDKLIELIESYGDIKNILNTTERQFSSDWYQFIKKKYNL